MRFYFFKFNKKLIKIIQNNRVTGDNVEDSYYVKRNRNIFVSSVFAVTNTKVRKDSPFMNHGKYLAPVEKAPSMADPNTGVKNDFSLSTRNPNAVLIDSSSNGYGMVVSTTRPIDNDGDWWTVAYRQYGYWNNSWSIRCHN